MILRKVEKEIRMNRVREQIERLYSLSKDELLSDVTANAIFESFLSELDSGRVRAAEKIEGFWSVNEWVKMGILLGFRLGKVVDMSLGNFKYFDKSTYPLKSVYLNDNIRIVPGGTSIRRGAHLCEDVAVIPPCFINVGAYVGSGTMLDSHSLVGSCAQIGERCHISASAQIGGVLEPISARPVIIEDDVFVGGNTGIYEGALIRRGAVIAAGVVITSSTKIFDLVNETTIESSGNRGIVIPENAVVVGGSRYAKGEFSESYGLSVYTPIIIKYRDEKIKAKLALEEALRF
jgi:2,3,4,5-tetrahydropyridine-2-carboxylate N-succinyltransferase